MADGADMPSEGHEEVVVRLGREEALVLFALLDRFGRTDALAIEDEAERRALWNLACAVERVLAEPFCEDFAARLELARSGLRDPIE